MGKLHEILAVESSQEKTANNMIVESIKTLGKESLFSGMTRELHMFRDEDKVLEIPEKQELTTTVDENIDYLADYVSKYWDTVLQKDRANTIAKADLIVDGKTIASDLPATFLLGLESKLVKLRAAYEAIPTLPPGRKWEVDLSHAKAPNAYIDVDKTEQLKTRKDVEFRVVYEATDHHPAQVVQVDRTADVGKYQTTNWSGKIPPVQKAIRLARITKLLQSIKEARMRANNIDVPARENIGNVLFDYINKGKV